MGGLRKYMPWTFWCMTSATFAIAGLPPFAAFFSKDAILWSDVGKRTARALADRHHCRRHDLVLHVPPVVPHVLRASIADRKQPMTVTGMATMHMRPVKATATALLTRAHG